jgi:hypothetical protein
MPHALTRRELLRKPLNFEVHSQATNPRNSPHVGLQDSTPYFDRLTQTSAFLLMNES